VEKSDIDTSMMLVVEAAAICRRNYRSKEMVKAKISLF